MTFRIPSILAKPDLAQKPLDGGADQLIFESMTRIVERTRARALATLILIIALAAVTGVAQAQQDPGSEAQPEMTEEEYQRQFEAAINQLEWQREGVGRIGEQATVDIPAGHRFTRKDGTAQVLELMGNPPSDTRLGLLAPEDLNWFVVFDYDDIGYVKDDEKDELDPTQILADLKEQSKITNEQRRDAGYGGLEVVGWAHPPKYNDRTNNLEWALQLKADSGEEVVNYRTKILGREGVMNAVLVCNPDQLDALLPDFQKRLASFQYLGGKKYAEFISGDRMAQVGLVGLIAGGTVFAAAKTGLLAKLLLSLKKLWVIIIAAVVGGFQWLKRMLTGRSSESGDANA